MLQHCVEVPLVVTGKPIQQSSQSYLARFHGKRLVHLGDKKLRKGQVAAMAIG